ncbi:MAG: M15 family metallopeptidase [Oscillospiraceae bacterium]|nr:M15 family metallopeptidase [Oscillospiraceae bacterium]
MKINKLLAVFFALALCLAIAILWKWRDPGKPEEIIYGEASGGKTTVVDPGTLPDPNATPEPDEDGVVWPDLTLKEMLDAENRQYAIVNDKNLLSAAFQPECDKISGTNNQLFEKSALPYLEAMLQDLRDHGFTPYVAGAFRTYSFQEKLFNGKASQIAAGMNPPVTDYLDPRYQEAVAVARTITAYPGSSEHQLGLGVDILDRQRSWLDYSTMNQDFFAYLDSICASYGFIKRYPSNKLPLTGWDEPYHYRYVGVEAATFIMEHGICYEEFYAHYDPDFSIK